MDGQVELDAPGRGEHSIRQVQLRVELHGDVEDVYHPVEGHLWPLMTLKSGGNFFNVANQTLGESGSRVVGILVVHAVAVARVGVAPAGLRILFCQGRDFGQNLLQSQTREDVVLLVLFVFSERDGALALRIGLVINCVRIKEDDFKGSVAS